MGRAVTHAVLLAFLSHRGFITDNLLTPPDREARSRGVQFMCFRMQGICTIYPLRPTQELIGKRVLPEKYF